MPVKFAAIIHVIFTLFAIGVARVLLLTPLQHRVIYLGALL